MMQTAKVGRPGKSQRICHACKKACLPKNGDWFFAGKNADTQVFLCKDCERHNGAQYQRTIPAR